MDHVSHLKQLYGAVLPCGSKLGRSASGCVVGILHVLCASKLDEVTAFIAHHCPQLRVNNPSDPGSRFAHILALHSLSPKCSSNIIILYDEALH